ncbi:hypothetical protein F9K91_07860 [Brucella tritici]|uniref:DNA ligase OB-like domain-containing protein n=1 Tax=Brucella tritici TaxID=94626 RepID=A0A833CML7_9HYPH|nr:hypothetical protein [Brucella tritici]KAB2666037.1 hypothetical protein F9K91_07860 [Brucella tritici]
MFKPLLAATADVALLKFPYYATPKIDGIRCLIMRDGAVTRSLKPIPNEHIRTILSSPVLVGLDGEILTFTDGKRDDFNTVQSKVMRKDGEPEFKLVAFDKFSEPDEAYSKRIIDMAAIYHSNMSPLLPDTITSLEELDAYEQRCVDEEGWEGVMLRKPNSIYKFGRSTTREGILLKVKRFYDDEAVILGTVEQMENGNEATVNALGHTERSSHKAGMIPKGTLGALACEWQGVRFELGTGFSQAQRDQLWAERDSLIGLKVTFKFQGVGTHGAPRFPVFLGIRRDI